MIKKYLPICLFLFSPILGVAEESSNSALSVESCEPDTAAEKIAHLSEAFGHLMAKHIESLGLGFDTNKVVQGLKDAFDGKASPMEESACIAEISKVRQESLAKAAQMNLEQANLFLEANAKNPGVVVQADGKLHILITKEGSGAAVKEGAAPLIRYVGKFRDGTIFGASREDDLISLDETIPGFGQGLLGMKEGEKRTICIHPDLGYGTSGQLPPNSLLIFDVELIKADTIKSLPEMTVEATDPLKTPQ